MKLLSNNIGSESILDPIKKLIGIEDTETYFDSDRHRNIQKDTNNK